MSKTGDSKSSLIIYEVLHLVKYYVSYSQRVFLFNIIQSYFKLVDYNTIARKKHTINKHTKTVANDNQLNMFTGLKQFFFE